MKMARLYGSRWTSHFGEADDGTWLKGLSGLAPKDIAYGYEQILMSGEEWPPGLPEFRAVCLGITDEEINGWIERAAKQKVDSFTWNQLSHRDLAMLKISCKSEGRRMCFDSKLKETVERNLLERPDASKLLQ